MKKNLIMMEKKREQRRHLLQCHQHNKISQVNYRTRKIDLHLI